MFMNEQLAFFKKPDPITDIKDVKQYDIVVVGAGSPGVPCALKAAELGAKVAIVQKLKSAMAGGNFGAGVLLDKSDPYDVARLVTLLERQPITGRNGASLKCGPTIPGKQ